MADNKLSGGQIETMRALARDLTRETLHGAVPMKTTLQVATDVLELCAHIAAVEGERDKLQREVNRLRMRDSLRIDLPFGGE